MTLAEIGGHLIFRQLGHYATDYDIAAIAIDPEGWLEQMRCKNWWTSELELEAVLLIMGYDEQNCT